MKISSTESNDACKPAGAVLAPGLCRPPALVVVNSLYLAGVTIAEQVGAVTDDE
jgi:hypothetical protein